MFQGKESTCTLIRMIQIKMWPTFAITFSIPQIAINIIIFLITCTLWLYSYSSNFLSCRWRKCVMKFGNKNWPLSKTNNRMMKPAQIQQKYSFIILKIVIYIFLIYHAQLYAGHAQSFGYIQFCHKVISNQHKTRKCNERILSKLSFFWHLVAIFSTNAFWNKKIQNLH